MTSLTECCVMLSFIGSPASGLWDAWYSAQAPRNSGMDRVATSFLITLLGVGGLAGCGAAVRRAAKHSGNYIGARRVPGFSRAVVGEYEARAVPIVWTGTGGLKRSPHG